MLFSCLEICPETFVAWREIATYLLLYCTGALDRYTHLASPLLSVYFQYLGSGNSLNSCHYLVIVSLLIERNRAREVEGQITALDPVAAS